MLQSSIKPPRKNPLPTVHEDQGNGILFSYMGNRMIVSGLRLPGHAALPASVRPIVCGLQPHKHGRPSPWGEDDAWWRRRAQQSSYHGAVRFRPARPEPA